MAGFMKQATAVAAVIALCAFTPNAWADGNWLRLDGPDKSHAAAYGYEVNTITSGDQVTIRILLDEKAAKGFLHAQLTLTKSGKTVVETTPGLVPVDRGKTRALTLTFNRQAIDGGTLLITSDYIEGTEPAAHFAGFQLSIATILAQAKTAEGKAAGNGADKRVPAEGDKPGSSPQQPLYVSLLQLIATPDTFDGKYVRVIGFVCIEHEGTGIYLHREDSEHGLTKNGIWLVVAETAVEGSKEAQVKDRYALIEGRFAAKKKGHRGMWSGSIEDITRMQHWEARKTKK